MESLRILHVEDDPLDAELMVTTLTDAGIVCDVSRIDTESGFRRALRAREFDLIVSDFSMPGFDGKSALRIAREQTPETPFIFVSGTIGEELAVESLLAGATDYVLKDHFSRRLVPAIKRAQREALQRNERKRIESQLLRAQRMESIGTLAGGIAHDLNNVLAPILMAIQLLMDRHPSDPSTQRLLKTLEESAKRGANIVRQVLTFARGTQGERLAIQLKHLLLNMQKMFVETFPKSIHIETSVPKDLWMVIGDPTQLDQVLLNLCVNARDAMPQGGLLRISAENAAFDENHARLNLDAKPGTYVVVEISDSGQGIPSNIIDRIFEPFFTTKPMGQGTGLGLSTTIAIVKSHGGFVTVSSQVGVGTTFKVFLPAKESSEAADSTEQFENVSSGKGEWILVIDDETAVRDIATATLDAYGYHVITASNGAEAIAAYAQHRENIKAVLLDMMMPIMDGPATIQALKAINPDVRIIAASGTTESMPLVGVADSAQVVQATLSKPYTAQNLLNTLQRVVGAAG